MWEPSRIIRNWRKYPLHWPAHIILILVGFYFISIFSLYLLYRQEKQDNSESLYYKALDIRRRELIHLKLSGAESFIWKPLFRCNEIEERSKRKDCIETKIAFIKSEERLKIAQKAEKPPVAADPDGAVTPEAVKPQEETPVHGYISQGENSVVFYETPPGPCFICHVEKEGRLIHWSFQYPAYVMKTAYIQIWESEDFRYFNFIVAALFVLYLAIRLLAARSGESDLLAVALRVENYEKLMADPALKPFLSSFFYLEVGNQYLRGYVSRKRYHMTLKKFFTVGSELFQRETRAVVLNCSSGKMSFEGLRVAQMIANKAPPGTVVIQESLSEEVKELEKAKKAVWSNEGKTFHFRVRQLSD